MGVATGQDFDRLIALRAKVARWLDGETLHGTLWRAGLPKTPGRRAGSRPRREQHRRHGARAAAARRPARRRVHAHGDGTDLRHGARRHGRRSHQGRADRRRPHAPAARRRRRLLPDVQPQQEEHRDRPAPSARAPRSRAGSRRAPTSSPRTSSPARWASTGSTTRRCRKLNPRLIYVSHKGFLPGPYDHRTALDEVVQMMGGLAYMTGRPGDPLRAGTSVNDIMGGLFGAIGALGALIQRGVTGRGHGGAVGAVREQRVPDGPAHAAVRDDRQAPGADARARQSVGGVRRVHGQGRRADLPAPR